MGPAAAGSTLDAALVHADDADDALAKVFALGGAADSAGCGWAATACAESTELIVRGLLAGFRGRYRPHDQFS